MDFIKKYSLHIVWTIALLATVGSLYFQYVLHFPPCAMCWYQRIFIYPLVVIIPIGLLKKDHALHFYAMALSLVGLLFSIYHNLLYYNIIPENLAPCVQGIACTTRYISIFGFLDIPQLSLISLLIIFLVSLIAQNKTEK